MLDLAIINDRHTDTTRHAGTTPKSAEALRSAALKSLADDVAAAFNQDLMLLGDLFSSITVPSRLVADVRAIFSNRAKHSLGATYLVAGNHDISKNSSEYSSFDLLAATLADYRNVKVIRQPCDIPHGHVIPHLQNQDLFNAAIAKAAKKQGPALFLHCNIDNGFAQADHSLNLTKDQILTLTGFKHIIVGHEHNKRFMGKVKIIGNQFPTSISDCLNCTKKYKGVLSGDELRLEETADIAQMFCELSLEEFMLGERPTTPFIRISGSVDAATAGKVISAIAAFRRASDAFVIANNVKIEVKDKAVPTNVIGSEGFDLKAAVKEILTPNEYTKVESCLAN